MNNQEGKRFDWKTPQNYEEAVESVKTVKSKVEKSLRNSISVICVIVIVALEVLHHFVTYGFNKEFAWNMVVLAVIDTAMATFSFYVLFPSGKAAKFATESYKACVSNLRECEMKIRAGGLLPVFRKYCLDLPKQEMEEKINANIEKLENYYVTKEEYEEKYRLMPKDALKQEVKTGIITKAAMKQILKCRKPVKTHVYSPSYFLSASASVQTEKYLFGDKYENRALMFKPVTVVAFVIVRNAFSINRAVNDDIIAVIVSILLSVAQICIASFTGYSGGWNAGEHHENVVNAKYNFLSRFICEHEQKKQ